jgi:hypothetical protein
MALPFINSVAQSMPGFGSAANYGAATQTITTTAGPTAIVIAATTTTPSSGGTPFNLDGAPPPSRGKYHIRSNTVNASTTTSITVTATDGTTTVLIGTVTAAAGIALDETREFNTDLSLTSLSFNITLGGSTFTASFDIEVSMTP